jgi:hypothetical protein
MPVILTPEPARRWDGSRWREAEDSSRGTEATCRSPLSSGDILRDMRALAFSLAAALGAMIGALLAGLPQFMGT